ncbi:MAG: SPASM domain-containing protein, partial [Deltaproteobacteria bacterium]|nr:SPASM domain-containing protein [Deltaproteobacteria bacterium]
NRETSAHPLEVYRFLRDEGVRFIQFIPIVERELGPRGKGLGLSLAAPEDETQAVTPWSVEPGAYGRFLADIFGEWVRNDVGRVFVMNFEWALGAWAGAGPGVCHLAPTCGRNLILEHTGDVYSCDHFMYPDYRLGNILKDNLADMVDSVAQTGFGQAKEGALPAKCRACEYLFACRGGCPKHRFGRTPDGERGLNYLCPGYRVFYQTVAPAMERMVDFLRRGLSVAKVMEEKDVVRAVDRLDDV